MNPSSLLVNAVLSGVLGGGRKQSRRARQFLTGGGGFFGNPSMLLTAAGLAWGVFETLEQTGASGQQTSPAGGGGQPVRDVPLPPLPGQVQATTDAAGTPAEGVSPQALRLIRLAISAANADGSMNDQERAAVLHEARAVGLEDVAERELAEPRPLREIVAAVKSAEESATLYVMAFTILRADESVKPTERVFLAQLATLLRIDPSTVEALERNAGERIDAVGDQGRPGG